MVRRLLPLALLAPSAALAMTTAPAPQPSPIAPPLTLAAPAPSVSGVLTRDVIRRVIYVHVNEIRHCYQQELQMRPALAGRVTFSFRITDRGQVRDLAVQRTSLNLPSLLLCLSEAMRKWEFPATYNRGVTQVTYPFLLRPRPKDLPTVGVQISDEELERLGVPRETEAPAADILFQ
jgi:hypothetical protein